MSLRNESKAEKDRQKQIEEKCQNLLTQMLRDEDNKYCVDCDAKGPRWASWNIGVFLCIRCAGIHRNLGTHISKVKSVNLDSWTPEQVVSLQQMGNSRARAVYEASLPDTWRRPQTDSSLETFIRTKYQHKRYIAKEWVPPSIPQVNWDKELDEEADKQKKKKREKQGSVVLPPIKHTLAASAVRVPALPKPTSSPKSNRSTSNNSEETKQSASVDLLGLSNTSSSAITTSNGNSDDVFSSFLSAPPSQAPTITEVKANITEVNDNKGRSAEEDSFFNQPAPNNETKKPLSKDSILALYGSQSASQPQPTIYPAQGYFPGNPSMGFPAPNTSNFQAPPTYPAPNMPAFNAPTGFGGGIRAPVNQPSAVPAAGSNPFFGISFGMMPPQGFPAQHGSVASKPSDDLLAEFSSGQNSGTLQQQMAGLNISQPGVGVGSVAPNFSAMSGVSFPAMQQNFANPQPQPSMGQTFTTHLWQ